MIPSIFKNTSKKKSHTTPPLARNSEEKQDEEHGEESIHKWEMLFQLADTIGL